MWHRLKAWLGTSSNPLLAARERGAGAFATAFRGAELWFFSLPAEFREGIPSSVSQEEALAFIERAAKDLAERRSFEPFSYSAPNGRNVLPLFTSEKHAEAFVRSYVNEVRRIIPFQGLSARGAALVEHLRAHDVILINPRSADELLVWDDEVRSLLAKEA